MRSLSAPVLPCSVAIACDIVGASGCAQRSQCWNPIVVHNAVDENASVVVTFTNPPPSFHYVAYNVFLMPKSGIKRRQTVTVEVNV